MKRVLYVEDNLDTAEAVKIILEGEGFKTDIVENGKDGLKMAKKTQYDLFLLDIMLPDMSGWDIYNELKPKVHAKFAFLSAIPISSDRRKQIEKEGVSDYITKPFAKKDLVERIKNVLS